MSDSIPRLDSASSASANHDAVIEELARPVTPRLRLWPGVALIALQWIVLLATRWIAPGGMMQFAIVFWGPIAIAACILIWWLFASRAPWGDRLVAVAVFAVSGAATWFLCDASFEPGFFRVVALAMHGLPLVTTGWVLWLLITPALPWPVRRAGLALAIALAWSWCTVIRLEGVDGAFTSKLAWRWEQTAEEKFLAERAQLATAAPASEKLSLQPGDWPEFRGPARDGRLSGVRIATDWKQRPPRELWRHRVGPGWSSFAVVGDSLFTQEQRGGDEVVVCYAADAGAERWAHRDAVRFTEAIAGPGPRATPTFHDGKIYALGAKGLLNCLDAATGKPIWSADIAKDSAAKVPQWGFSASPLVANGLVTVFAGGADGKSVLAYDASTGARAWSAGKGKDSYASPHLARLGGVPQLLMATDAGLTSLDPKTGSQLWHHEWQTEAPLTRIVQPAILSDTDVLFGTGFNNGTRRLHIDNAAGSWTDKEVLTTRAISPYFNDLVIHEGQLYGFEGIFLICVNIEDGASRWKARGYGNGQVLLLADQGLLLVLTEKGDVALVEAKPEKHVELARFKALDGKTWNHPVVAHGKLFVRNGEEMACFELNAEYSGR